MNKKHIGYVFFGIFYLLVFWAMPIYAADYNLQEAILSIGIVHGVFVGYIFLMLLCYWCFD